MVQSKAATVDDYIAEASPERAAALRRLRETARRELPGHVEAMGWGMPVYLREGEPEVAFASQKQYISRYIKKTNVLAKNSEALAGLDRGKGCIRFRRPADIDFELVGKLFRDSAESDDRPC